MTVLEALLLSHILLVGFLAWSHNLLFAELQDLRSTRKRSRSEGAESGDSEGAAEEEEGEEEEEGDEEDMEESKEEEEEEEEDERDAKPPNKKAKVAAKTPPAAKMGGKKAVAKSGEENRPDGNEEELHEERTKEEAAPTKTALPKGALKSHKLAAGAATAVAAAAMRSDEPAAQVPAPERAHATPAVKKTTLAKGKKEGAKPLPTDDELKAAALTVLQGEDVSKFSLNKLMAKMSEQFDTVLTSKKAFVKQVAVDYINAKPTTSAATTAEAEEAGQPAGKFDAPAGAADAPAVEADAPAAEGPAVTAEALTGAAADGHVFAAAEAPSAAEEEQVV